MYSRSASYHPQLPGEVSPSHCDPTRTESKSMVVKQSDPPGEGRWKNTHRNGPEDLHSLSALVHFMVLEKLDLISAEARGWLESPVGDVGFWASGEDVDNIS